MCSLNRIGLQNKPENLQWRSEPNDLKNKNERELALE